MRLQVIGPHPFSVDEKGRQITRIGTVFPTQNVLYTELPGVHAWQRAGFIDYLNHEREAEGQPPLTIEQEEEITAQSVDLIFEPDHILIRPNPERMDLTFAADDVLQNLVSKRQIKFLSASDKRVREGIKRRGEIWRLSAIPKSREAKERMVMHSKVNIHGLPIYFYNRLTGTRWLTYNEFEKLELLNDKDLALHLQEIADHALRRNRLTHPEVSFFAADLRRFLSKDFAGVVFEQLSSEALREKYHELRDHFRSAVHEAFRKDDCHNRAWCERIIYTLFLEGNETQAELALMNLSPEFFMQVDWLPGGRFEEGEFLFDPVFEEAAAHPGDTELRRLTDPRSKGIILNFIREYGDLNYINVGCIPESLSLVRPQKDGRRGVYLVEFKSQAQPEPIKRFLRLQKWGVWEHLDEGKSLLQSIEESDEYTDYWFDRRLACRQLGMNLSRRVLMRRLTEQYAGSNARYVGCSIRTTYFEREYVLGIATDKLPVERYSKPGYALKFAELLGRAAAPSIVVGRSFELGTQPLFDDGDEVVREGEDGLPLEILVCDHSGAFGEYKLPLEAASAHYARPINVRAKAVANVREFADVYLESFREQLEHIQGDYRKRRRAFDTLFKHCKYDTGGSLAYRWESVLRRLDNLVINDLVAAVRHQIRRY